MALPENLHDPRMLKALAHPIRARIMDEITAAGPTRAADVARDLGIPANQASFHLRELAKYGLVEEDPDAARDKRDRVWRTTSQRGYSVNLVELEKEPGGKAAVRAFRQNKETWSHHVVDRAFNTEHRKGSGVFSTSDITLKLTDEEAHQLRAEVDELVETWGERTRGRSADRRTYLMLNLLQPYPED